MNIFITLLLAISLSMDAFSLSLAYGTLNISNKHICFLSCIVGIYHFLMPILGNNLGHVIFNFIKIKPNTIVFIVLLFIGINMIFESFKSKKKEIFLHISQMLLFGFAVSIDSFSLGIGISAITNKIFVAASVFALTSFLFTYLGLKLGKKINVLIGNLSTILGGLSLIIIAFFYLMK